MTPRQLRFIEEYLKDLDPKGAYIRSGFSERGAYQSAHRLLKNAEIRAKIAQAQEKRAARTGVTLDRVINELARVAFADLRRVTEWGPKGVVPIDCNTLSDDDAMAVAEVSQVVTDSGGSLKVKLHPKLPALELLLKHCLLELGKPTKRTAHVVEDDVRQDLLREIEQHAILPHHERGNGKSGNGAGH